MFAWAAAIAFVPFVTPASAAGGTNQVDRLPDGWHTNPAEGSIYFEQGSAILDSSAETAIQRHLGYISVNPQLVVTLVAHTDDLGSPSLEIARGQQRLDAVLRRLDESGVSRTRIRTINLGSQVAKAIPCEEDRCRGLRRRVDVLFHK